MLKFQRKVMKHLVEHGLDTITYLPDPAYTFTFYWVSQGQDYPDLGYEVPIEFPTASKPANRTRGTELNVFVRRRTFL